MSRDAVHRIGVLGGTFDPIHLGHLRMAEEAVESLGLDCCLFVPAWVPPHKPHLKILSYEHRRQMVMLAIAGHPHFRISDVERDLRGKSYTLLTLRALKAALPRRTTLTFLVGRDAFFEMQTWWKYRDIFRIAEVAVFDRPLPVPRDPLSFLQHHVSPDYRRDPSSFSYRSQHFSTVRWLSTTRLDIASSRIRKLVAEKKSIRFLVPDSVLDYIDKNGLYREPDPETKPQKGGKDHR